MEQNKNHAYRELTYVLSLLKDRNSHEYPRPTRTEFTSIR